MKKLSTSFLALTIAGAFSSVALAEKIVEEPLTLDIHFHFADSDTYHNDWPVETVAAEATGIHLNNVASLATAKSQEAFNLLIASGNIPAIVGGNSLKDKFNQYGPEGAFLPLEDLIKEHAPHIQAVFDEKPEVYKSLLASDGHLYHIPYFADGYYARAYHIRQDWLDKLGLEQPDTVDDLYDVLVAFRDQDPNGNGEKDEVPFFARDWEEMIRLVTLWDGRSTGTDKYHGFYVEDGELRHGYSEENYKVGMTNLSKWYAEGLIDQEIFTRGKKAREEMFGSDIGGMTHDWFASTGTYNDSLKDTVPGINIRAMLPPKSPSGRRLEENRRTAAKPDGWAMGYTNEYPVETIKYFDYYFTEEGKRLVNFGIEGEQYDMVDGKPIFKPEVLTSDVPLNNQLKEIGAQQPRGFPQDYSYEIQWTNPIALEGIALYETEDLLVPEFLGVALLPEEQAVYDKNWASIMTYMQEQQQRWILGSGNVDEEWADYQATLEKMGYNDVMEVMNTAYTRQYGG